MKKTLSSIAAVALLGSYLHADISSSIERNNLISVYGVNAKTDTNHPSKNGGGMFYNTEALKVMMENTSDFFKAGTVIKFNPFDEQLYFKVGGNYINQRLYAPDNASARVNQYSGAFGAGYMLDNDLYVELGGSSTKLNGKMIGTVYSIDSETTNRAYAEIAKRFDTRVGTLDTTFTAGRVYRQHGTDSNSYGTGIDYYPMNNVKLGYYYTHTDNAIASTYSLSYGYLTASYSDSLSQKKHYASLGVQFAFSDITDLSTYKMPTNIKPHLSELHAFEQMTFGANMNIQSTNGVRRTDNASSDTVAPAAPTGLSLNSGATYTNSTTVTLDGLTGNGDVAGWYVSESGTVPSALDVGWVSGKPTSYTLSSGDGTKMVYVYVKDATGNVQSTAVLDTIILDTVFSYQYYGTNALGLSFGENFSSFTAWGDTTYDNGMGFGENLASFTNIVIKDSLDNSVQGTVSDGSIFGNTATMTITWPASTTPSGYAYIEGVATDFAGNQITVRTSGDYCPAP